MTLKEPAETRIIASVAEGRANRASKIDRNHQLLILLILLVLYGLLQNRYWVPAGDSEFYIAAARSLARGEGYRFNGLPVASAPPGWPAMMAVVMRITPYFLPLKLLAMGCMIGSLSVAYAIVRRFVSPREAVAVILFTALLSHVYQATYWLISESAFCLATTSAILVAMQIAEGRRPRWRVVLLLVLCAAASSIRISGLLNMGLIVGVLLDGELKPRKTTVWITAALVILVTSLTFLGWRVGLRVPREELYAAAGATTMPVEQTPAEELNPVISGAADQTARTYQLFPRGSIGDRFLNWGHWFSYLYWQPLRAAGGSASIAIVSALLGWTIIVLLGVLVISACKRRRWIWLGAGLYAGALAMAWNVVNARYYLPIAFLITLGIFLSAELLIHASAEARIRRIAVRSLFVVFIASVILCNAATYSIEVSIARSPDFYQRYEAGMNESLIAACQYLSALPADQQPGEREIAVSQRYTNLGHSRGLPSALRMAAMLTGRSFVTPRFRDTAVSPATPTGKGLAIRRWLRYRGVRYYLWQPPISPWRVWHFRMAWLEKARTGHTAEIETSGWQLVRLEHDGSATQLPVPRQCEPITRVPLL